MVVNSKLSPERLVEFKTGATDENAKIAAAIKDIMPPSQGGIIVDAGAGLGDIAAMAFPDRAADLVDILQFPANGVALHRTLQVDLFEYRLDPAVSHIDVMLMSHVLQYVDDDPVSLQRCIERLAPRHVITVTNEDTDLNREIKNWYAQNEITENSEHDIDDIVLSRYDVVSSIKISGIIRAFDELALARFMSSMIFDSELYGPDFEKFAFFLKSIVGSSELSIPQDIILYQRKAENE